MSSVNKVILVGNVGQDPKIVQTQNGTTIANLSVATSESWRDKNTGERREKTEWHRVSIFGKLAEIVSEYVHKGSKLYLEGQLQTRKWQDQQGQDRYTTEVVLQGYGGRMVMLDGRQQDATERKPAQRKAPVRQAAAPAQGEIDDEIPF